MFDTKSSFILSKLGIQGFIPRDKKPNKEEIFGALWGNILTLIDKPFNELDANELDLLTKNSRARTKDTILFINVQPIRVLLIEIDKFH